MRPGSNMALAMLVWLAGSACSAQGLYRWVDDAGEVHYGDNIPPSQIGYGHARFDAEGRVIATIERAKTDAELAAERRRAARAEQRRRRERAQVRRDRALLETFTTQADLELARDDRLAAVESQLRIAEQKQAALRAKESELEERIERLEPDATPPQYLADGLATTRRRLQQGDAHIEAWTQDKGEIEKRFAADLARFRELKSRVAN